MSLVATLPLTNEQTVYIFQGSNGKYYHIKDSSVKTNFTTIINYDIHFPLDWIFSEETSYCPYGKPFTTGPLSCLNCKEHGFYNGVFISYCANCAQEFEYKRGNGVIEVGIEINEEMAAFDLSEIKKENSMWNTYLKNVNLNEIGDTQLKEEYELYKDLPDLISIEEDNNYDAQFKDDEEDYEYEYEAEYSDPDEDDKKERKVEKMIDTQLKEEYKLYKNLPHFISIEEENNYDSQFNDNEYDYEAEYEAEYSDPDEDDEDDKTERKIEKMINKLSRRDR